MLAPKTPSPSLRGGVGEGTGTGHLERKPFSSQLVEGRAQAWGLRESSWEPYPGRMAALGNHKQLRTALEGEFSTMRLKGDCHLPGGKEAFSSHLRRLRTQECPHHLFPTLLLCPPRSNPHTASFSPFLLVFNKVQLYSGSGSLVHFYIWICLP